MQASKNKGRALHTSTYILHEVIRDAHDIIHNALRGELHDIKPGNVCQTALVAEACITWKLTEGIHQKRGGFLVSPPEECFVSDSREPLESVHRDSSMVQVVPIH